MIVNELEALDLRERCFLCRDRTRDPNSAPNVNREIPWSGHPVARHGLFVPSGLYATARPIRYGLCGSHASRMSQGSADAAELEALLLRRAVGDTRVPMTDVPS